MSFFDLENELPCWLGEVINTHAGFKEIVDQTVINKFDIVSPISYHLLCADKGSMVNGNQQHHIWKFEATEGKMRAYGKYLEYNGIKFWIGIVDAKKTITLSLWFDNPPPETIKNCLKSVTLLEREKGGYWYNFNKQNENVGQVSDILTDYCSCDSNPLNEKELEKLKKAVTAAISYLFTQFSKL